MAQLVEHILGKDEVSSSNLDISSRNALTSVRAFSFFRFSNHKHGKGSHYVRRPSFAQ